MYVAIEVISFLLLLLTDSLVSEPSRGSRRKGGPHARVSSPVPGFSILITSAPRSANCIVAKGPARTRVKSKTLMPARGGGRGGGGADEEVEEEEEEKQEEEDEEEEEEEEEDDAEPPTPQQEENDIVRGVVYR